MKTNALFFLAKFLLLPLAGGSASAVVLGGVGFVVVATGFPVVEPLPIQDQSTAAIDRREFMA